MERDKLIEFYKTLNEKEFLTLIKRQMESSQRITALSGKITSKDRNPVKRINSLRALMDKYYDELECIDDSEIIKIIVSNDSEPLNNNVIYLDDYRKGV